MGKHVERLDKSSHASVEPNTQERPLLPEESAAELEALFKMLGSLLVDIRRLLKRQPRYSTR